MFASTRSTLIRTLMIVLGAAVIGASLGSIAATLRPQSYTSTATVMVMPSKDLESARTEPVSQFILSNMPTYNNLAMTASVLSGATDHGRSQEEIASGLKIEVPTGSTLVKIAYTDQDIDKSTAIADDLADGLRDTIRQYSPGSAATADLDVAIVQNAGAATIDNKPNAFAWAALGALLGAAIGGAVVQALNKRRSLQWQPYRVEDYDQEPGAGSSLL